jgi:hypothetical protein
MASSKQPSGSSKPSVVSSSQSVSATSYSSNMDVMSGRGFFRDRKYLPIRLAFLLAIALPLSWFAWQRWEFSQWMKEARTAISRFDDQRGIELLDRIERRHGKSGQTLWPRARSARHARRYEELQRFADGAMRFGCAGDDGGTREAAGRCTKRFL